MELEWMLENEWLVSRASASAPARSTFVPPSQEPCPEGADSTPPELIPSILLSCTGGRLVTALSSFT